jgi:N-acetyl-gamma-glutamyl-phosphate reductase
MTEQKKLRAGILGASGYTGAELVRLLSRHPNVEIVVMTADRKAGQSLDVVFPHLGRLELPDLMAFEDVEWGGLELDVIFCALPHATSQPIIKGLLHGVHHSVVDEMIVEQTEDITSSVQGKLKIVDLSADFRLRDPKAYLEWYGNEHIALDLQKEAVYGLTEIYREQIKKARLVACPGCYPTAALLTLVPLLKAGLILTEDIIIDAKSGVSGAGRSLKETNLFTEVAEGMHAYGVGQHRHSPEIEQELAVAAGKPLTINFTPHLVPMNRGEYESIYVKLAPGKTADDLRDGLAKQYADEKFVHVVGKGVMPASRYVRGSNDCVIGVFEDRIPGRAILIATIDNLVKGSSGQAIQNMNIMFGLPEVTGLEQAPLFP